MRAVLRRDFSFVDGLFAEDVRWRTPGAEGGIQGRAAVHAFFQGLTGLFSGHTIELVDALEDGERLVCFCLHRFTRPDGASGEVESVMDWRCSSGRSSRCTSSPTPWRSRRLPGSSLRRRRPAPGARL